MYHIIVNLEEACTVYENYMRANDPDSPEPKRGSKIALLKKLNEVINEEIDGWCFCSDIDSLKTHYQYTLEDDEYNVSELLYELFLVYIPTSVYVNVDIMDSHGNVVITLEE